MEALPDGRPQAKAVNKAPEKLESLLHLLNV